MLIVEPKVFRDARGFFFESFNARRFAEVSGISAPFVWDNHSRSAKGALRGLHYQIRQPQGKLVWVVAGEVFDVAVDLRRTSPTFGKRTGNNLSAENERHLWIPAGLKAVGESVRRPFAYYDNNVPGTRRRTVPVCAITFT